MAATYVPLEFSHCPLYAALFQGTLTVGNDCGEGSPIVKINVCHRQTYNVHTSARGNPSKGLRLH
jgi:hypothetical protein